MRSLVALALALVLAACSESAVDTSSVTTTTTALTSTTTPTTTTTSTVPVLRCDPADFLPTVLPSGVEAGSVVPLDPFTSIPGAASSVWVDGSGEISLLLVRGALPPERWVTTPESITVRGVDAALGELPGGHVAVAWFEGPERCDEYSLILYPPGEKATVREIAESFFPEA